MSVVDGPGLRAVVWAQGCAHCCPGCHNPETWDFAGGKEWTVEVAFAEVMRIMDENPMLRGVTFSGGDPFYQAIEFARLARMIKRAMDKDIVCFTGFTLEELMGGATGVGFASAGPARAGFVGAPSKRNGWRTPGMAAELLETVDILIDGPYLEEQKDLSLPYRGSRNQRIIDLRVLRAAAADVAAAREQSAD